MLNTLQGQFYSCDDSVNECQLALKERVVSISSFYNNTTSMHI